MIMNKININWKELRNLSNKTEENLIIFENSRKKFQEIIVSIEECWKGIDSNNFIIQTNNYLESLKNDTEYLNKWITLFRRSANRYNGGIDEGLNKVRNVEEEYILPKVNEISEEVMWNEQ